MAITYKGTRFAGYNKPKRTPKHPTKSHAVLVKKGEKVKLVRFGSQGAKTYPPRKGESQRAKETRRNWYARHGDNLKKADEFSPLYWAAKVKW
jgi:hypothetical protein